MKRVFISILITVLVIFQASCSRLSTQNSTHIATPSEIANSPKVAEDEQSLIITSPISTPSPQTPTPSIEPVIITTSPIPQDEDIEEKLDDGTSDNSIIPPLAETIALSNRVIDQNNILITKIDELRSEIKIIELSDKGEPINDVIMLSGLHWFPYSIQGNIIFLSSKQGLALYNFDDKSIIELPESETCYPVGFFKENPYVLYSNGYNDEGTYKVHIYDYVNKKLFKTLSGYRARISTLDDSIFFLTYHENEESYSISVSSYDVNNDELLVRLDLQMDDYTFDITEVVPLSKEFFTYRIYDEHEFRYNTNKDYVISTKGNQYSEDVHKEQYNFTFSSDGEIACMAERDWGSLTYIAYGDYTKEEMYQTEYFGSFPIFQNDLIYFLSDQSFVNCPDEERQFRQIENYALYSIDPKTNELKAVYKSDVPFEFIDRF